MPFPHLNRADIELALPHRYENLLLDTVDIMDATTANGQFSVTITEHDLLGRDIFFRTVGDRKQLISPVFMEILALASIVSGGGVKPDQILFYAGIRQFSVMGEAYLGERITGTVRRASQKGPFVQFTGDISVDGRLIVSGSMTAFIANKADISPTEESESSVTLETFTYPHTLSIQANRDLFSKPADMIAIDRLVHLDLASGVGIGDYVYPEHHVLTRGHFPGLPVMMGVMQMMMAEDLGCLILNHLGINSPTIVTCDAEIKGADGGVISDLKGLRLQTLFNAGHMCGVSMIEAKRVTFKRRVAPSDFVSIHLSSLTLESVS